MNRQQLPIITAAPDLSARVTEVRLPGRATAHDLRNEREAQI